MNAESQKRLIVLTALEQLGGSSTKAKVLDFAEEQQLVAITPEREAHRPSRKEPAWRNELAYVRQHLASKGVEMLDGSVKNKWTLTAKGRPPPRLRSPAA
jgi:hypothetical protein